MPYPQDIGIPVIHDLLQEPFLSLPLLYLIPCILPPPGDYRLARLHALIPLERAYPLIVVLHLVKYGGLDLHLEQIDGLAHFPLVDKLKSPQVDQALEQVVVVVSLTLVQVARDPTF